jgi:hypothetical protein
VRAPPFQPILSSPPSLPNPAQDPSNQHRLVVCRQVGVPAGHAQLPMTEDVRNLEQRCTILRQVAGTAMSQVMEPEVLDLRRLQCPLPGNVEVIWDARGMRRTKDQRIRASGHARGPTLPEARA